MKNTEVDRRAGFVDSLLNADESAAFISEDLSDTSGQNDSQMSHAQEDKSLRDAGIDKIAESMFLVCYRRISIVAYKSHLNLPVIEGWFSLYYLLNMSRQSLIFFMHFLGNKIASPVLIFHCSLCWFFPLFCI